MGKPERIPPGGQLGYKPLLRRVDRCPNGWLVGMPGRFPGRPQNVTERARHFPNATQGRCDGIKRATNDREDGRADDDWYRDSPQDFTLGTTGRVSSARHLTSKGSDEGNHQAHNYSPHAKGMASWLTEGWAAPRIMARRSTLEQPVRGTQRAAYRKPSESVIPSGTVSATTVSRCPPDGLYRALKTTRTSRRYFPFGPSMRATMSVAFDAQPA